MKTIGGIAALALLAIAPAQAQTDPFAKQRIEWNKPQKPFRVIDNVYYVGTAGVSAWLIWTLQGFILIDGGLPESAAIIEANIKELKFDIKDVKILLNSHAHFDHAGGLAKLKRDSGARLTASAGDKAILERGRVTFGPSQANPFPRVTVDRTIKDGDTVALGGVVLTAVVTPGHSPGGIGLFEKKTGTFLSGDIIYDGPLIDDAYHSDVPVYVKTLDRLRTLPVSIVHGGHFASFGPVRYRQLIDEYVAGHRKPGCHLG